MDDQRTVGEILVELNADRTTVWRARVDSLRLVVDADSPAEAQRAAIAAVISAGGRLSENLRVRVRFGTRAERLAAGWVPPPSGVSAPRR